jgi:hypothetical protein
MITAKNYHVFLIVLIASFVLFQNAGAGEQINRQLKIDLDAAKKGDQPAGSSSFTVKEVVTQSGTQPVSQPDTESKKSQTTSGGQPHLVIASTTHDAGEVWEGEDIVHAFVIKNTGTAELSIKDVKAG